MFLKHKLFIYLFIYFFFQTLSVLNPLQQADAVALRNTDLAGPLIFCLLFGGTLLLVRHKIYNTKLLATYLADIYQFYISILQLLILMIFPPNPPINTINTPPISPL